MKKPNAVVESRLQYSSNYFSLLELQLRFEIDFDSLEKSYFKEQKRLNTLEQSKDLVILLADLNNAYTTLKSDYNRAVYILLLNGIDIKSEFDNRDILGKEFLIEILELTEEIDSLNNYVKITNSKAIVENLREKIIENLNQSFNKSDFKEFLINTQKLKYYDNILAKLEEKIEKCL
jgi:molecular chaperone HscB